jgi:hypothetical protein
MDSPRTPDSRGRKRWYDKHDGLAEALEALKGASKRDRDELVDQIKGILTRNDPHFIDKQCDKFPLSPFKRRWYDKDPYLWLVINALRYTDDQTITEVVSLLNKTA